MYTLPTFNITVAIWHFPNSPPAVPDLVVLGNLCTGRRVYSEEFAQPNMFLLLPPGTDIRSPTLTPPTGDVVEAPAGSLRFYSCVFVDDVAKAFPNEHRFAVLIQNVGLAGSWPTPYP